MKLYFENSYGLRKFLCSVSTLNQANIIMSDFLKGHNYKSYYTRMWYEEEKQELWFDVGSHSEFFVLTDVKEMPTF